VTLRPMGETRKSVRILVVDDYEPWRNFISNTLKKEPGLEVVGNVSDGSAAVRQAQQLQPDLILLDIGLPTLNGIEAAVRIRETSPNSKILFVSQNRYVDIAEKVLSTGAAGFVIKSDAASELLPAIQAILQGKQFVSSTLLRNQSGAPSATADPHRHEVAFFQDDTSLVDGYAQFIESTLKARNAIIVAVTESHRAPLFLRLKADGVDVAGAVERGTFIPVDAADALSSLTINGMPEQTLCAKVVADLLAMAAKSVEQKHSRVVFCGGIAPILLSKGNAEGAIQLEHMWDKVTRDYGIQTLCGYVRTASLSKDPGSSFDRICAEHSAIWNLRY
jgi:DNA-binding NarL/FixJ family response regulator